MSGKSGSILLRGGEVISPYDSNCLDVFIKDGVIAAVGRDLKLSADLVQ